MPRSRCHFALLTKLHEALRSELPDIGELADRELVAFNAGGVAPDALRYFSDLGKYGTHFYSETRKETWGHAVSGMFDAHPDLSDPAGLNDSNLALILGYISHLTVDEAFRDVVTIHVHGTEDWRPIIQGLWSMMDEIPFSSGGLSDTLAAYRGDSDVGFIAGNMVRDFVNMVGPVAETEDPWEAEKVFLKLIKDHRPEAEAQKTWLRNRESASRFVDEARTQEFVKEAVKLGLEEITAFVNGGYCKSPCVS
jgi:hypothetical protein